MKMTTKLASFVLMSTLFLAGCNTFRVYTIDIPQGTPITAEQASKVRVGMTADQVIYILGSPAIQDTLNPNRFDYLYDYTAGTDGKRAGKQNVKNANHYLSIYFENGRVVRILGRETLPTKE